MRYYKSILLLVLSFSVTACGMNGQHQSAPYDVSVVSLLRHDTVVNAENVEVHAEYQDSLLERLGAIVQVNGQEVTVILQSDQLYHANNTHMRQEAHRLMQALVDYLKTFEKMAVTVSAYSDDADSEARAYAITKAQAKHVTSYLWEHNVDARVITADGYGQLYPIADNNKSEGREQNRRIEVTLRFLDDA